MTKKQLYGKIDNYLDLGGEGITTIMSVLELIVFLLPFMILVVPFAFLGKILRKVKK